MAKYKAKKSTVVEEEKPKKVKKIKPTREISEGETEVRRFICILVIIAVLAAGMYFLAKVNNDKDNKNTTNTLIQYNDISVGMILNRDYEEYYVLVFDFSNSATKSLATTYRLNGEIKLFTVDMSDKINAKFVSSEGKNNPKATKVSEMMFGQTTLLHIKDGKITEYLTDASKIEKKLK